MKAMNRASLDKQPGLAVIKNWWYEQKKTQALSNESAKRAQQYQDVRRGPKLVVSTSQSEYNWDGSKLSPGAVTRRRLIGATKNNHS